MPRCTLSQRTQIHIDYIRHLMNHPDRFNLIKKTFHAINEQSEVELFKANHNRNSPLYAEVFSYPENAQKNRYSNIFPFDYNLVHILNSPDGNYINASVISLPLTNGYSRDHAYIATQGPLSSTMNDFWRMIYQRQVNLIVCLSQPMEGPGHSKPKYHVYWKEQGSFLVPFTDGTQLIIAHKYTESMKKPGKMMQAYQKQLKLGPRYQFHPNSIEVFSSFQSMELRIFELKYLIPQEKNTYTTTVYHLSTSAWPDHGVIPMDEFLALLEFSRFINYSIRHPLIVHCSAGCGRSGTFIAVDFITRYLEDAIAYPDFERSEDLVYSTVMDLRRQRVQMVQTPDQLALVYEAISYYLHGLSLLKP